MYAVYYHDEMGNQIILLTFSSLKDAWLYGRKWRKSQPGMADSEVFIEYTHGSSGAQLIGNLVQVALGFQS